MSNTSTFISKGVVDNLTTLSSSLNLTSFYGGGASSYLVEVGTFNYDAYGQGIAFRQDGGPIDDYINAVPIGPRDWTFTPSSGAPFTISLLAPTSQTSIAPADAGANIWVLNTADSLSLQGTGPDQLNYTTFPDGTSFNISAGIIAGVTNTVNRARFVHCTATSNTTTIRVINESSEILGELYLHSIGDSITIEKAASDSISLISGGVKAHAVGSPRS